MIEDSSRLTSTTCVLTLRVVQYVGRRVTRFPRHPRWVLGQRTGEDHSLCSRVEKVLLIVEWEMKTSEVQKTGGRRRLVGR